MEGAEPILRRIRQLEDRIRKRQDTINYFTTVIELRREETGLTHREMMTIDASYRHTFYSIRALKGWQTRDRREKEELEKIIPPIQALRIILTFSIETGEGHEPFYAEVTCNTIIGIDVSREEQDKIISRICNATIKLFWILFDTLKDVAQEYRELWGAELYDYIVKRARFFQRYATVIYEEAMDNFLKALMKLGGLQRDLEEYVTRKAILKIGVEYHVAPADVEPRYPNVDVLVEKGKSKTQKGDWIIERRIIIAPITDVNILEILSMAVR